MHWKLMTDTKWLIAEHLEGKDYVLTIERVEAGEVEGEGGRKAKKPVLHFKGRKLPLALANTNSKVIAGMYGPETEKWRGRKVQIYPTTTRLAGDIVSCIRIRPTIPTAADGPVGKAADERQPGGEG